MKINRIRKQGGQAGVVKHNFTAPTGHNILSLGYREVAAATERLLVYGRIV